MAPKLVKICLSAAAGVCAVALADGDQREDATRSLLKILSAGEPKAKALEKKRDIVVVGGGVCGLSTAWEVFKFKVLISFNQKFITRMDFTHCAFKHMKSTIIALSNGVECWLREMFSCACSAFKFLFALRARG